MNIYITFITGVLGSAAFLPVQISFAIDEPIGVSELDENDVFTLIAKNNKGSRKLISQGDIAVRLSRSAIRCPGNSCLWPKSSTGMVIVPYTISPDYMAAEAGVISSAMQEYTTLTCIRFIERKTEVDYIQIQSVDGCWSYLGRIGGVQDLSLLRSGCLSKGIVQHELNHVLGFVHEHTRSDRDIYVDIIWPNIPAAYVSNFAKSELETNHLSLQYDYLSVMHYGRYSFTRAIGQATINPKPDATVPIGQRYGLSSLDLQKINRLYECDVCSSLLCEPSGSLHSETLNASNKSACLWLIRVPAYKVFLQFKAPNSPGFMKAFDGASRTSPLLLNRTCQVGAGELPPLVSSGNLMLLEFIPNGLSMFTAWYSTVNCGGTLTSSAGTLTSPGYPIRYPSSTSCTWTIVAPVGFRVLLNFNAFSLESSRKCMYDSLSVSDESRSGPDKYCGTSKIPSLISSQSWFLLHFLTDESVQNSGFQATYSWGE
ncbi:embryonic protein UVS.2-like [Pelodytes ibericus]